jgi:hypothetical protein
MSNMLFVAWRGGENEDGRWGPVGRLEHGEGGYRFVYTRGARQLEGFRPLPGMPDLDEVYESDELFPLFANRLLAPSRPEYKAFLEWGDLDPNNRPNPIAQLAVSEGQRATDAFELFPCPLPVVAGSCYVSTFFLHGVRWAPPAALERIARLQPCETLGLMIDISNRYDSRAVAVRTCDLHGRFLIGYVPRYLAPDVRDLCSKCEPLDIALTVKRVNPDAPLQQRVLCKMTTFCRSDFHPCSGDEFQPIVDSLFPMAP